MHEPGVCGWNGRRAEKLDLLYEDLPRQGLSCQVVTWADTFHQLPNEKMLAQILDSAITILAWLELSKALGTTAIRIYAGLIDYSRFLSKTETDMLVIRPGGVFTLVLLLRIVPTERVLHQYSLRE